MWVFHFVLKTLTNWITLIYCPKIPSGGRYTERISRGHPVVAIRKLVVNINWKNIESHLGPRRRVGRWGVPWRSRGVLRRSARSTAWWNAESIATVPFHAPSLHRLGPQPRHHTPLPMTHRYESYQRNLRFPAILMQGRHGNDKSMCFWALKISNILTIEANQSQGRSWISSKLS